MSGKNILYFYEYKLSLKKKRQMKLGYLEFFLLASFFILTKELQCEDEKIDHCTKCNTGNDSDSCSSCEDKYFPFFNNLLCYPCNDSLFGQEGCIGKCNSTNITYARHALCEEGGCKEGYYYEDGNCYNCSMRLNGCKKCTYKKQENRTYGYVICQECENSDYKLTSDGRCQLCYSTGCEECHYEDNYNKTVCDKCFDGYYRDLNGQCKQCRTSYIDNGYCIICSDNGTDYDSCYCDYDSVKIGDSNCTKCPDNCDRCEINNRTNSIECLSCSYPYIINSNKDCIKCSDGCNSCTLDKNNNPICTSCYSGYTLYESSCYKCTDYCNKCTVNESSKNKNETICTECSYDRILNEEKKCISCYDISDIGCYSCFYNETTKKYGCLECNSEYKVYINNTYECLDNLETKHENLKNCHRAFYDEKTKTYECLECVYNTMKYFNETKCKYKSDLGLSNLCTEIDNVGTPQNPIYSCTKCQNNAVLLAMNSKDKKKDCIGRSYNLSFCTEGEMDENGKYICSKCVEHATLNSSGYCECNSDSFEKYGNCYKCDDKQEGNIGCIASKGCYFNDSIYSFVCNECKIGYYLQNGKCYSCSDKISNCDACHLDKNGTIRCDTCKGIYIVNTTNDTIDKCILNECEEYPDIAPGCIICKDKLNEYKKDNKCQTCKYGYFKTKSESCVYCRAEQYGGPACYECVYEEDQYGNEKDNIICKDCFSNYSFPLKQKYNSILSSDGKCYSCQYDLSEKCVICDFIKDDKNPKELQCLFCDIGYYVDSDGMCINFIDKIETIPNCNRHEFNISNISFYFGNDPNDISYSFYYNLNATNYNDFNNALRSLKSTIKPICKSCESNYYLNDKGECQIINFKDCIGSFMIKDPYQLIEKCRYICGINGYPIYYMIFTNNGLNLEIDNYNNISYYDLREISYILYNFNYTDNKTQNFVLNRSLCYEISNGNLEEKFKGCNRIIYIPKTNSYHCFDCSYLYMMDNKTNTCKLIERNNSISDHNCTSGQALVSYDFGIKDCISKYSISELRNCLEANASTKYLNTSYNCSSCDTYYLPYYSKFYKRNICHNAFEKITKKNNISLDIFEGQEYIEAQNGGCPSSYFSPNGTYCYKCDNDIVGMPGCKGDCNFSLERYNEIICKGECKEGYLESSEGICESCDSINPGCYKCHVENNTNYIRRKSSKIFQCDNCLEGYIKTIEDGICKKCSKLGLGDCEKCEIDENSKSYKCTKCAEYSVLDDYGECHRCIMTGAIINNKCILCNEISEGGIKNCSYCQSNEEGNGVACKQCEEDYILLSTNNSCLEREKNKALYEFDSCLELKEENNKLVCSRCKPYYSLLKIGEEYKCSYIPTLYDENFQRHLYYHYNGDSSIYEYARNDYNFRQTNFFPCKETINLGTNENPNYSCNKCYNLFDNEGIDYEYYEEVFFDELNEGNYFDNSYYDIRPIKVNDSTIKNGYCFKALNYFQNCSEAAHIIKNGKEIFNCTKCIKDNELTKFEEMLKNDKFAYNNEIKELNNSIIISDYYLCTYKENSEEKCLVNYCQKCASDKNNFCSDCISSEYELNNLIGSCVKKTNVQPAVTWKNIYKLNMTGQKRINGRIIKGPTFKIRGITCSQIYKGYIFLFYLTFKLKSQLRYLEENIKAPAICEVDGDIEKSTSHTNMVDGDCIVNTTNTPLNENYELINIEGGNLNETILAEKISNKIPSVDLPIVFEMTNIPNNIESNDDNIFKFTLNGKLKENNAPSEKKNIEIELNEIDKKTICDFKKNEQLEASFDCILELEDNTKEYYLTFKNNEISIGDGYPNIYIESLEQVKLINKNGEKEKENEGEKEKENESGKGKENGSGKGKENESGKGKENESGKEKENESGKEKENESGKEKENESGKEKENENGTENGNKTQTNNRFYQTTKKGSSHKTLAIVLGIVGGVIALVALGIAIIFSRKPNISNATNLSNINSLTQVSVNNSKDISNYNNA